MSELINKIKKIILIAGDLAVLYGALYLTLIARFGYPLEPNVWQRHFIPFSLVFLTWLIIFFINDFYDLKASYQINRLLNNLTKALLIGGLIAVVIFYFIGPLIDSIRPQRILIINLIFTLIGIFIWRRIFYQFIKLPTITNQVLILGRSLLGEQLYQEINRRSQLGYQAAIIDQIPDDLTQYCLKNKIDILISSNNQQNQEEITKKIFACLPLGVDVYNLSSFYEQITNKIPVENIEHSWFLENLTEHSKKVYEIIKRLMDMTIAIIGLIIAIPLWPIIALIIKLETPGPIIFKQIRVGKNGKEFMAMKFRSMVQDAEKGGPQWAQKNDPRITRFGSFMRKTRLDEIPQLINVLKGEMSFVGPRPERPEFVKTLTLEIPFYQERLLIKPGLTGWAQLYGPAYGGSKEETLEKLKYDLYYLKNRSLILDLNILLKTIKIITQGKGQ